MSKEIECLEWLEKVVDAIGITDGVDLVEWKLEDAAYLVMIEYGEEVFGFEAGTDGGNHGVDYDASIFDMTTPDQVQWWFAGELYERLQAAKRKLVELQMERGDV